MTRTAKPGGAFLGSGRRLARPAETAEIAGAAEVGEPAGTGEEGLTRSGSGATEGDGEGASDFGM